MVECDRNKSDLTRQITAAASHWLSERGFKPIESEVSMSRGWVADLAGVCCPTCTEALKLKLIPKCPNVEMVSGKYDFGNIDSWRKLYDAVPSPLTAIVEVKVSRSDFVGDKKWNREPVANLNYVAMPQGIVREEEWPAQWGILICNSDGGVRRLARPATLIEQSFERQMWTIHEIAVRRDHHTRYERFREFDRQARARQNVEISRTRVLDAMRVVLKVARGERESVDAILEWHRIKNLPEHVVAELRGIWGIAKRKEVTEHT